MDSLKENKHAQTKTQIQQDSTIIQQARVDMKVLESAMSVKSVKDVAGKIKDYQRTI